MGPSLQRRTGVSITATACTLAIVLRHQLLPVPLLVMAALYFIMSYAIWMKRLASRWAPLLILMLGLPTVAFIYANRAERNGFHFIISDMVAVVISLGLALMVFRFPEPRRRSSAIEASR